MKNKCVCFRKHLYVVCGYYCPPQTPTVPNIKINFHSRTTAVQYVLGVSYSYYKEYLAIKDKLTFSLHISTVLLLFPFLCTRDSTFLLTTRSPVYVVLKRSGCSFFFFSSENPNAPFSCRCTSC